MGRFGLAFKTFFRVLSDDTFAEGARGLMEGKSLAVPASAPAPAPATAKAVSPAVPTRSDALTLLSVLQREARLVGNVTGNPPFRGNLRHAGWEATKVQLPEWTGAASAAKVIAPAEVEIP